MGKKHKKHKSNWQHADDTGSEKTPLKLVLKLGSEVMYDSDYAANSPMSSAHDAPSHKHKKRKKKRHHEEAVDMETSSLQDVASPAVATDVLLQPELQVCSPEQASLTESPAVDNVLPEDPIPMPAITEIKKNVRKPLMTPRKRKALNRLLDYLLKQLERKDTQDIFAWPVTDLIAPGYSSVIDKPMDFSTINTKITTNQYSNVSDFKQDFELMIDNCCLYNKPDTVYWDIAKKVSGAGKKIFSLDRLRNLKRTLPYLNTLSKQEMNDVFGLELEEEITDIIGSNVILDEDNLPIRETTLNDGEENEDAFEDVDLRAHADAISFTDADNEDTVAPDAIQAMKKAHKLLEKQKPRSRMGFLRMDADGKTTLNILNPDRGEETQCEVDLGTLTNNASSGIDVMPETKEDKRNKVTPLQYLSYGPFGSYAPTYDSRISNLTQEESDLLLSAYGGETGYLIAKSMEEFVSDSPKGLIRMVGDLLDTVTHGAHNQAIQDIEAKRSKLKAKQVNSGDPNASKDIPINFKELRSLQDLGIDVSFLDEIEEKKLFKDTSGESEHQPNKIEESLDRSSALLNKLEQEQNSRLSVKPANKEPNLQPPTEKENEIASELQKTLVELTASASPQMVCDVSGVRKAMGVFTST